MRRWRRWWRSADRVVVTVVVSGLLALLGVIGAGENHLLRTEHFDAKQVIVVPDGTDGLRITEVVDVDFARNSRHGYRREIPNDFGEPTNVRATSTANARVDVEPVGSDTRIRVGSPDDTYRGRQRYRLTYTLPAAGLAADRLSLDVIGTDETLVTDRFDVWISGFRLADVDCDRGRWAARGGCTFVERDGMWFASVDDLRPGEGITVTGDIVGRSDVAEPPLRPRPAGWSPRWAMAGLLLAASLATLGVLYVFSRWYGTNRVGAGGGSGAAFPESDDVAQRIPDARLADLAATDFSPPTGMRPWQGALAVNEAVDERSIVAWFSEMVAIGALVLNVSESGATSVRRAEAGPTPIPAEAAIVDALFRDHSIVTFSGYSTSLADAWQRIARQQERFAATSNWWHRDVPTYRSQRPPLQPNWSVISFVAVVYVVASLILFRSLLTPLTPLSWLFSKPLVCIVAVVVATAVAAYQAFAPIRPARSVMGTATALRVLGFRTFLEQSEGRHVEAAWDRRRIREYSAWAVVLGAATAWADQIELLPAPAEPIHVEWAQALDRVMSSVDLDSVATFDPLRRGGDRADPWRAIGRGIKWYGEHAGSGGGGGGSSFSGGSSSGGVGSGGGGSSGTW